MAVDVTLDLKMIIDGVAVAVHERPLAGGPQPGDRGAGRARPGRHRGGRRPRRRGGPGGVQGRPLASDGDAGARHDHEPARRPARPRRGRARPARDAPDRHVLQAPARVRLRVRQRQPALLRDPDPEPRGQGRLRVQRQPHELRPARADRRRRPGQPVELPDVDGDLEDRAGAGGRELDRPEARQRDAADDDPPGRAGAGGRRAGRRAQRRHRAAATSSARHWRRTWTWTSSR